MLQTSPDTGNCLELTTIAMDVHASCIGSSVRRLDRIVSKAYDLALRSLNLTGTQFTLLCYIARKHGIASVEIGNAANIDKSTLSRNLKRLLKSGYITMDPPCGPRRRGLFLTMKGEESIRRAHPSWEKVNQKLRATLGLNNTCNLAVILEAVEKTS